MNPTVNSAAQWMKCHASVKAQQEFPRMGELPLSTMEGTACHDIAQEMMKGNDDCLIGTESANGVFITPELFDAAQEYVNDVRSICGDHELHIEQKVELYDFLPGWYGIPDCYIYNPVDDHLIIWEAKFGHELVEAKNNWPMLIYAIGICKKLNLERSCKITLRVVQPRGFHSGGISREWSLDYAKLFDYEVMLSDALFSITKNQSQMRAQVGSQCKYCSARSHCDTLSRVNYENIDYMNVLDTHNLTGHSLGVELKLLKRAKRMLDYRLSGLEEQAVHELKTGSRVSFFGLKESSGREIWRKNVPTNQIIMMGELMGVDMRKPIELNTPSQARKKGIDETVISQYSETPSTGLKLVEIDEISAKSVFEKG